MPVPPLQPRTLPWLGAVSALAGVYFLAARFGLSLGVAEQVTAVWPPTGIALAALMILGRSAWPGVWLGALAANIAASEPLGTALGIATGNTLEAVAGAWLLQRAGVARTLDRLKDVVALILLAACFATALSATIGVTSLCLGGVHPWSRFDDLWWVWWLGDAMGALLVAPVLLVWSRWPRGAWSAVRLAEAGLLAAGLLVVLGIVFSERAASLPLAPPYVVFPFVIWTALRFGQRGTSLCLLATSGVATWATARGRGPFGAVSPDERWDYLVIFLGVVAATGLLLGAAISERDRSERHRAAESAVAKILAQGGTLGEAARRIVEAICHALGYDLGALWTVDRDAGLLRCVELWHRSDVRVPEFEATSRQRTFAAGVGLPGRVWSAGRPAWIRDVVEDPNFPRAPAAAREGLHGAFGFPVVLEGEVLGVLEFFSREIQQPDDKLLQLLGSAGSQIGQFIERKEAEEAVAASEARKAGVLASVLDAIITIDHRGKLVEFNRGAEQIFGLSTAAVLGQEMAALIVPERLREQHRHGLARFLATGTSAMFDRRLEMPALRADGSEFPVELTITRVADTEPPLLTGYLRDITERRRSEEERAQLLAREQAARSRAESLTEDLRQQQAAKDQFLAMLGHELRNPLAPVANALHVLGARDDLEPDVRRLHEMMTHQLGHVVRLVDDLLDVSRIASGRIELRRERVDLSEALARAVEANRGAFEERHHRLSVSLPERPLWVVADATRLMQIVSNLLGNAARYTPAGGAVSLSLAREGDQAVIRVRDNGMGIRPELLRSIFELFVQADRLPGSVQQGLGLGLTLVKTLVELHGGTVTAESGGPGKGSEFVVRLPVREDAQAAAPAPEARAARTPAAARRVLVVDDNHDSAHTMALLLQRAGHATEIAHDGQEALAAFRARRPDVVLLDIQLPHGMSGHDVARQMLEEPGNGVLLVAMTGYGQAQDRERSRAAGFHHHLVKPIDAAEVLRIIEQARPAGK